MLLLAKVLDHMGPMTILDVSLQDPGHSRAFVIGNGLMHHLESYLVIEPLPCCMGMTATTRRSRA